MKYKLKDLLLVIFTLVNITRADTREDPYSINIDVISSFALTALTESYMTSFGLEKYYSSNKLVIKIPVNLGYHHDDLEYLFLYGTGLDIKRLFSDSYYGWNISANLQLNHILYQFYPESEVHEVGHTPPRTILTGGAYFGYIWHFKTSIYSFSAGANLYHLLRREEKALVLFSPMMSFTIGFPFSIKSILKINAD